MNAFDVVVVNIFKYVLESLDLSRVSFISVRNIGRAGQFKMRELPLGQQPCHRILDATTAIARKHVYRTIAAAHLTSNCSIGLDK